MLQIPYPSALEPRESARIKRIAQLLDCDESQVRRLITAGDLEAHGIGRRGVRVYLDSVEAYRERQQILPRQPGGLRRPKVPPTPCPASRQAHEKAVARLRERGLL